MYQFALRVAHQSGVGKRQTDTADPLADRLGRQVPRALRIALIDAWSWRPSTTPVLRKDAGIGTSRVARVDGRVEDDRELRPGPLVYSLRTEFKDSRSDTS
jgi:hypothetical protein